VGEKEKGIIEKFSEILAILLITGTGVYVPLANTNSDPFEVYSVVVKKYDYSRIGSVVSVDPSLSITKPEEIDTQEIKNEKIEFRLPLPAPKTLVIE